MRSLGIDVGASLSRPSDTPRETPEEPMASHLLERVRGSVQAGNDRDIDWALTFYPPDAVWDMSPFGMGTFEGIEAIRGFFEDWLGAYEEHATEPEEIVDLASGVSFAVLHQKAVSSAAARSWSATGSGRVGVALAWPRTPRAR
jgi:ketosteroid isomerase-like protein